MNDHVKFTKTNYLKILSRPLKFKNISKIIVIQCNSDIRNIHLIILKLCSHFYFLYTYYMLLIICSKKKNILQFFFHFTIHFQALMAEF